MVMKDKLVKNNHKSSYFIFKKLSLIVLAVSCFACAVFIPTYIINSSNKKNIGVAQETSSEVTEEVEVSTEEENKE